MSAILKLRPPRASAAAGKAQPRPGALKTAATGQDNNDTALSAAKMVQIQTAVSEQSGFEEIAAALCVQLARTLGATRVGIAWQHTGAANIKLQCASTAPVQMFRSALRNTLLACAAEAMYQQRSVNSLGHNANGAISAAQRSLAQMTASCVITVPMACEQIALGAIIIELPAGLYPFASSQTRPRIALVTSFIEHLLPPVTRLLKLTEVFSVPTRQLIWQRLTLRWNTKDHAVKKRRRWLAAGAAIGLLAVLIPFTQSVSSNARLEGAVERVIAAPVDGYLESVLVRPGDTVQTGQILASLRPDELEIERNQLRADLARQQVAVNAAMVSNDQAAMAAARAEIDQSNAKIALLDLQITQTKIRAPMSATILQGDLIERIQTPVQRGEALFTLTPDDKLRVRIEVEAQDIQHVRLGQHGVLAPTASPWERLGLEVIRIAPTASVIDGKNVVTVHAQLSQDVQGLKPGHQGIVHLNGKHQNLAQRWLGDLFEAAARVWWRWQPW